MVRVSLSHPCNVEFLVLYLGILWMSLRGESFHAYPRLIR